MSKKQKEVEEEVLQEGVAAEEELTDSEESRDLPDNDTAKEAAPELTEEEKLKQVIASLEEENSSLKDQMLRKQAEADNFRKRLLRDKEESIKYANTNLLTDLVAIIDDFERAIKSSKDSRDFDNFHSGVELIEKQFVSMLERNWGLKRLTAVGEEFDPQYHEAIGMEESSEYDVQTVVEDYLSGYLLQDRILRPAKVKVAMPVPGGKAEVSEEESE